MSTTTAVGLDLLKQREGVVLKMYRDSAGLPTIGCGHLLTRDELTSGKLNVGGCDIPWRDGITAEQSDTLLRRDLETAEAAVRSGVTVPLSPTQYDTLVSFAFNVGGGAFRKSTLLRLLNAGDYKAVPGQLARWKYSAGRIDPILVNRRKSEAKQWAAG